MKAVSKHGPALQNIPIEFRTKSICMAAVLSCKALGYNQRYALKNVPDQFKDECSTIYSNSSIIIDFSQIEKSVKKKISEALKIDRNYVEAFEKIKAHIQNLDDLNSKLDKLYTLLQDIESLKSDLRRNPQKNKYTNYKINFLSEKAQESLNDIQRQIKKLDVSKFEYFDAASFCNSDKEIGDFQEEIISNVGDTVLGNTQMTFEEIFSDIAKKCNVNPQHAIEQIKKLGESCHAKKSLFFANADIIARIDDGKSNEVNKRYFELRNKVELVNAFSEPVKYLETYSDELTEESEQKLKNDKNKSNELKNHIRFVTSEYAKKLEIFKANNPTKEMIQNWNVLTRRFSDEIKNIIEFVDFDDLETFLGDIEELKINLNSYLDDFDELIQECELDKNTQSNTIDEFKTTQQNDVSEEGETVEKQEVKNNGFVDADLQERWNQIVKKDIFRIKEVPEIYQTQEMWNAYIMQNIYAAENMPEKFQTQEIWDEYVKRTSDVTKVPEKFQTQEMWNIFANAFSFAELKVPKQFQTQEMWNAFVEKSPFFIIENIPEEFRSQKVLDAYEKLKPQENNADNEKLTESEELKEAPEENVEEKEQTLRQKYNFDNEEDFNLLLARYAKMNKIYYSIEGRKRTDEEMKKRRNINAQFKRVLQRKAKTVSQNEDGTNFESVIKNIETGCMFSNYDLEEVAKNNEACLKLFNIMASGIYEKEGQKVRLNQKQRVALSSTLEIVSSMRLDMDYNKKKNKTESVVANENVNAAVYGE